MSTGKSKSKDKSKSKSKSKRQPHAPAPSVATNDDSDDNSLSSSSSSSSDDDNSSSTVNARPAAAAAPPRSRSKRDSETLRMRAENAAERVVAERTLARRNHLIHVVLPSELEGVDSAQAMLAVFAKHPELSEFACDRSGVPLGEYTSALTAYRIAASNQVARFRTGNQTEVAFKALRCGFTPMSFLRMPIDADSGDDDDVAVAALCADTLVRAALSHAPSMALSKEDADLHKLIDLSIREFDAVRLVDRASVTPRKRGSAAAAAPARKAVATPADDASIAAAETLKNEARAEARRQRDRERRQAARLGTKVVVPPARSSTPSAPPSKKRSASADTSTKSKSKSKTQTQTNGNSELHRKKSKGADKSEPPAYEYDEPPQPEPESELADVESAQPADAEPDTETAPEPAAEPEPEPEPEPEAKDVVEVIASGFASTANALDDTAF